MRIGVADQVMKILETAGGTVVSYCPRQMERGAAAGPSQGAGGVGSQASRSEILLRSLLRSRWT
jgi:hypothetical protein